MAKKPESRLQRNIRLHLESSFRCKFFKVWGGPFTEVGLPDLVGCVDGLFFGLEVKRDASDSQASEAQLEVLAQFRRVGGVACVVTSPAEAAAVVRAAKRLSKGGGKLRVEPTGGRPILRPEDWEDLDGPSSDRAARVPKYSSRRSPNK